MKINVNRLSVCAALALVATPAAAQNAADPAVSPVAVHDDNDRDDFPWGLLGLLGLGGLIGRKRDHDHDHRTGTNNANR